MRRWLSSMVRTVFGLTIVALVFGVSAASAKQIHESMKVVSVPRELRHLRWFYGFDPPGSQQRDWVQVSPNAWNEVYEKGSVTHFTVFNPDLTVRGVHGQAVINQAGDNIVFIPDRGSTGDTGRWLLFRSPQSGPNEWKGLGEFEEVAYNNSGAAVTRSKNSRDASANPAANEELGSLPKPHPETPPPPHSSIQCPCTWDSAMLKGAAVEPTGSSDTSSVPAKPHWDEQAYQQKVANWQAQMQENQQAHEDYDRQKAAVAKQLAESVEKAREAEEDWKRRVAETAEQARQQQVDWERRVAACKTGDYSQCAPQSNPQ